MRIIGGRAIGRGAESSLFKGIQLEFALDNALYKTGLQKRLGTERR
jgi:hypothetical protein